MIAFLLALHVLICVFLVLVILLQSSKGGGLAGAFGGMGGAGTVFGGRGAATFLSKVTGILAVLFFLSSIGHSFLSRQALRPQSVIRQAAQEGQMETPTSPASVLPGVSGTEQPAGATTTPAGTGQEAKPEQQNNQNNQ